MNLNKAQRDLLLFLSQNEEGLTIRDIQDALGWSTTSLVHHHIKALERQGALKRNPGNPKDFKVLYHPQNQAVLVNYYGEGSCGPEGTLLSGDPQERLPLSSKLIPFSVEHAFIIKAKGDSMNPKISAGDLLLVEQLPDAEDGTIIVCTLDGAVHVKRWDQENKRLISYNDSYEPISLSSENAFTIEGIVRSKLMAGFD